MFDKILKLLEDPKYPCLGPHLRLLSLTGLWHPVLNRKTRFKITLFYITVLFFFSQYIKCGIFFNTDSVKLILQYMPFHMGIVKTCFFYRQYDKWSQMIEFISNLETHQLNQKWFNDLQKDYIKRSRRVTYFFWALAFFSNFSIFSEPYRKNQSNGNGTSTYVYIFDGYTPFSRVPPGYYCSMFIQTVFGHIVSAYVVVWDTCVVSVMIFFAGQLKIFRAYSRNIFNGGNVVKHHQQIANCHFFYTELVKYQNLFNSLISPVMFVYLIVISVSLGVCIIQIVELQDDIGALLSAGLFLIACLIQLLIFYWHSNEVTNESLYACCGPYESNWVGADLRLQREVALLIATTNRRLIFKAGPFNEMSLSTFVSILRTSYSFFTLLNETASNK
ncbi:unnamed protein product [Colias eurytheme]|nr:unnamed protein product [Colias eurytheme]